MKVCDHTSGDPVCVAGNDEQLRGAFQGVGICSIEVGENILQCLGAWQKWPLSVFVGIKLPDEKICIWIILQYYPKPVQAFQRSHRGGSHCDNLPLVVG